MKWPTVRLGEVADVKIGPFGSLLHKHDYLEGGVPLVNPMHIDSGEIVPDRRHAISPEKASQLANYRMAEGDVVLARRGEMGRCAVVRAVHHGFLCGTGSLIVRPGPSLSSEFLSRLLSSTDMVRNMERASLGTTMPNLNQSIVASLEIPLPPPVEQRRIAAILDHADALRVQRHYVRARLNELAQSIFLDMFVDQVELRPISQLCELLVDCVNRTAPTVPGPTSYKMLRTTNVRNGRVDTTNVRFVTQEVIDRWNRRATPQRGDVILTREAPVGEAGILESDDQVFLGQRLFLYRTDPTQITPEFLLACFRSPLLRAQFERLGSGSTVKHLPLPACQSFMIPAPPIEEQREYSARVSAISKSAMLMEDAAELNLDLFTALQSQVFSG